MDWLNRPASWKALILTYAGLVSIGTYGFVSGHERDQKLERQDTALCKVVRNVHTNAIFRWKTEQAALMGQRAYVNDPKAQRKNPDLVRRVRESLPVTEGRVAVARRGVVATRVPATCATDRSTRADRKLIRSPLLPGAPSDRQPESVQPQTHQPQG